MPKWKKVFGLRRRGRNAYEAIPCTAQGEPKIVEQMDCEENVHGKLKSARKTQKHDFHWGQDGRQGHDFFYLFLPGRPQARPQGPKDLKNLFLAPKIINIWPPELHKWTQDYPKLKLDLKSEPRK